MTDDPHAEYLARAVSALTPEGHRRVDQLLDELVESAGGHPQVIAFAQVRRREVDDGRLEEPLPHPEEQLAVAELNVVIQGFLVIRDQEPRDDVGDWANAVIQLLEPLARALN